MSKEAGTRCSSRNLRLGGLRAITVAIARNQELSCADVRRPVDVSRTPVQRFGGTGTRPGIPHSRSSSDNLSGRQAVRSPATPSGHSGQISPSMPSGAPSAGKGRCRRPPETVAAFVDAKAELRAPATVRRYVTSIAIAHRALGLEKTIKSPPVQLALKRMHRRKGRRQDQATGLTWPRRQRLLAGCGRPTDRRPQPGAASHRLRRHAPQDGAGVPASH